MGADESKAWRKLKNRGSGWTGWHPAGTMLSLRCSAMAGSLGHDAASATSWRRPRKGSGAGNRAWPSADVCAPAGSWASRNTCRTPCHPYPMAAMMQGIQLQRRSAYAPQVPVKMQNGRRADTQSVPRKRSRCLPGRRHRLRLARSELFAMDCRYQKREATGASLHLCYESRRYARLCRPTHCQSVTGVPSIRTFVPSSSVFTVSW